MAPPSALERAVFDAVRRQGPTHPRDLDAEFGQASVQNDWGGKSRETKRALELLHRRGWLRVASRTKGVRVYEAVEAPSTVDGTEALRSLLQLVAGLLEPIRMRYLRWIMGRLGKAHVTRSAGRAAIDSALAEGSLREFVWEGERYVASASAPQGGETTPRVRIIAPFDPLVHDRERFEQLWGWSYRFEAYTPAAKRECGYYAMPLLWRDDVVGWANVSVVKGAIDVDLGFVNGPPDDALFREALDEEIARMAAFLGVER